KHSARRVTCAIHQSPRAAQPASGATAGGAMAIKWTYGEPGWQEKKAQWVAERNRPPDEQKTANVRDCCRLDAGARVGATTLYIAFRAWCEANGEFKRTHKWFAAQLKERGLGQRRSGSSGSREWHGLEVAKPLIGPEMFARLDAVRNPREARN